MSGALPLLQGTWSEVVRRRDAIDADQSVKVLPVETTAKLTAEEFRAVIHELIAKAEALPEDEGGVLDDDPYTQLLAEKFGRMGLQVQ